MLRMLDIRMQPDEDSGTNRHYTYKQGGKKEHGSFELGEFSSRFVDRYSGYSKCGYIREFSRAAAVLAKYERVSNDSNNDEG